MGQRAAKERTARHYRPGSAKCLCSGGLRDARSIGPGRRVRLRLYGCLFLCNICFQSHTLLYLSPPPFSLPNSELNEFNQCQTKIKELTLGTGAGGASSSAGDDDAVTLTPSKKKSKKSNKSSMKLIRQDEDVADEFAGYRLLYALVQKNWGDVNKELKVAATMISAEDRRVHAEKERDERMSSCRHAQLVVNAMVQCDYHAFFVLYENAPHMSCYLMDFLLNRIRCGAYERIIAAFRPSISVESIRETLKFRDLEETRQFLKSSGAVFVKESGGAPPFFVDTKASKNSS